MNKSQMEISIPLLYWLIHQTVITIKNYEYICNSCHSFFIFHLHAKVFNLFGFNTNNCSVKILSNIICLTLLSVEIYERPATSHCQRG